MVLIQAGHQNIESNCWDGSGGSTNMRTGTGAPGEKDWTPTIAARVVGILRDHGAQARAVDANFNCDPAVGQDYEALVSVHYQANLPTASGFFVGAGDPLEDGARAKSGALAQAIFANYQRITGLPWRPSWSNVNISHYYLFEVLSKATPFVLIECGVGAPGAPDHDFLHSPDGMDKVSGGIAAGILTYLGIPLVKPTPVEPPVVDPCADVKTQLTTALAQLATATQLTGAQQAELTTWHTWAGNMPK